MFDFDRAAIDALYPFIKTIPGYVWAQFSDSVGNGGVLAVWITTILIYSSLQKSRSLQHCAVSMLASLALSGIYVQILKFLTGRGRPVLDLHSFSFMPFSTANNWHSFPSGHSTSCFALAATAAYFYPDKKNLWYLLAFFISFGRVISESHFPTDIMGGAFLGILSGYTTSRFIEKKIAWPKSCE